MVELRVLSPGRRTKVSVGERFLSQLGNVAAILASDKEGILAAQEVASVQGGQIQKRGFRLSVPEAPQTPTAFARRHGNLAHKERITAVISRSSSTRLSLDAESSAAYILNPASALAWSAGP